MSTPYEDLQSANDAYHVAIGEVFCVTDGIDPEKLVEVKAELGDIAKSVFDRMDRVNKLLEPYYGGS